LTGTHASAAYVAAGGYIHVSEWLDEFRFVPTSRRALAWPIGPDAAIGPARP
jgi:hypothetical protein